MAIEITIEVTIEVTEDSRQYIRRLEQTNFLGQRGGKPVHGIIIDRDNDLFFDVTNDKIRSFYELDTLMVMPADFETILIELGD